MLSSVVPSNYLFFCPTACLSLLLTESNLVLVGEVPKASPATKVPESEILGKNKVRR